MHVNALSKRGTGLAAAGLLTAAACLSAATAAPAKADTVVPQQEISIPAYIYIAPNGSNLGDWQRILDAASPDPTGGASAPLRTVVVNFGSPGGPGTADQPNVDVNKAMIKALRGLGVTVAGYVDTGYFSRNPWQGPLPGEPTNPTDWLTRVNTQTDAWYTIYKGSGLNGIFFDRAYNGLTKTPGAVDCTGAADYAAARQHIQTQWDPNAFVVANAGSITPQCYADQADQVVTFEGTLAGYKSYQIPDGTAYAWMKDPANAARQWHLVWNACPTPNTVPAFVPPTNLPPGTPVPTTTTDCAGEIKAAVAHSRQVNAGDVYVTTLDQNGLAGDAASTWKSVGNPWAALTTYPSWSSLVAAVKS
ncbi:spherulation-specific family 4 protein [Catenulispora subtropica]|uniref:spherulation-specific family 4 protein n=1 Tax=Catenulispora subtropica TaxID=450798 RepID=UPI0031E38E9C